MLYCPAFSTARLDDSEWTEQVASSSRDFGVDTSFGHSMQIRLPHQGAAIQTQTGIQLEHVATIKRNVGKLKHSNNTRTLWVLMRNELNMWVWQWVESNWTSRRQLGQVLEPWPLLLMLLLLLPRLIVNDLCGSVAASAILWPQEESELQPQPERTLDAAAPNWNKSLCADENMQRAIRLQKILVGHCLGQKQRTLENELAPKSQPTSCSSSAQWLSWLRVRVSGESRRRPLGAGYKGWQSGRRACRRGQLTGYSSAPVLLCKVYRLFQVVAIEYSMRKKDVKPRAFHLV